MKPRSSFAITAIMGATLSLAGADTLRYRLSGDWNKVADAASAGWGLNPNPEGVPGAALPGVADEARINWSGNQVTITGQVPSVNRIAIGVDESGTLVVAKGGIITSTDIMAGNNGTDATGKLIVQAGGKAKVGNILWAADGGSTGIIEVQLGGLVTVGSHLWWGVNGKATITIGGEIAQTDGILGLGTNNATTASGGTATVDILKGGKLNLNQISAEPGTPSIQPGSKIQIHPGGLLSVKGDQTVTLTNYIAADRIVGTTGKLRVSFDPDTNLTYVALRRGGPRP